MPPKTRSELSNPKKGIKELTNSQQQLSKHSSGYQKGEDLLNKHQDKMVKTIKHFLKGFPPQQIKQLAIRAFPLALRADVYENLNEAMKSVGQVRISNGGTFKQAVEEMVAYAQNPDPIFQKAVQSLLADKDYLSYLQQNVTALYKPLYPEVISLESSPEVQQVDRMPAKIDVLPHTDKTPNLAGKGTCICEQQLQPTKSTFPCMHCGVYFHYSCMRRNDNLQHCLFCHLRQILPNRAVCKTIFVGHLKKGRKKHIVEIFLTEQDISKRYKVQVRCFRVHAEAKNAILFPDACQIVVNGQKVHEFEPLHRMSSLKHRKDEAFYIEYKYLKPMANKITITERMPSKATRQSRIENYHHILGLYLVEQVNSGVLVSRLLSQALTTYQQSSKILKQPFTITEAVHCQSYKVSAVCNLTSDKITIPARGLFCQHFQCFDLKNFIIITSQANYPKWNCPICKQPAYRFRIDCIFLAILQKHSEVPISQIILNHLGQYIIQAKGKVVEQSRMSIEALKIEQLTEKAMVQLKSAPQKKRKIEESLPNLDVIQLG